MAISERPGVYSSVEVSSALSGAGNGKTVGVVACAETGTKGECVNVTSYGEAAAKFGADCALTKLVKVLFQNGAAAVKAVAAAVGGAATVEDYVDAFAELENKEEVTILICDSTAAEVATAMKNSIENCTENCRYRIGILETDGDVSDAAARAAALNFERVVMAYPSVTGSTGAVAAAIAGVLSAQSDPALPLNGAVLSGVDGFARVYTDNEVTTLVTAGVTAVESIYGEPAVVRGVTTRTKTGGAADSTFRELTTILIIDDVIPAVRAALRRKFSRVKNTAQTRGAIRTQVIIELEDKCRKEIIESFDNVTAVADAEDPTVCNVGFDFTVAHGLNRIVLSAHISV
ncbi:MAG: phage tail sheath subtilisin-like domain-containing protein [Oscillospiraceae bacterium]|jgi:hypothetical protein